MKILPSILGNFTAKRSRIRRAALVMEELEDRRVLSAADCGRSTCGGFGPSNEGTNVTSFDTLMDTMSFNSNSGNAIQASPETTGSNGPLVYHKASQVGALLSEFPGTQYLRFRVKASHLGSYSPFYTSDWAYYSTEDLVVSSSGGSDIIFAGIIPNDTSGFGTETFKFDFDFQYKNPTTGYQPAPGSGYGGSDFTFHNRSASVYGHGWWLDDHVFLQERNNTDRDISWFSGQTTAFFDFGTVGGTYQTPLGMFGTLLKHGDSAYGKGYYTFDDDSGNTYRFDPEVPVIGTAVSGRYQLTLRTDANGNEWIYSYSLDGNSDGWKNELTSRTDPFGRTVSLAYSNGKLVSMTDDSERVMTFDYDGNDLVGVDYPIVPDQSGSGTVTPMLEFEYIADGLLWKAKDPLEHITEFEYRNGTRLASVTYADGAVHSYNAMYARPLEAGDSEGTAAAAIDSLQLRSEEYSVRGHSVHKVANEFGQIESQFYVPQGYDEFGAVTGALSYLVTNRDVSGRLELHQSIVPQEGNPDYLAETTYTYSGSHVTEIEFPDGESIHFNNPNSVGLPREIKDQIDRTTILVYDQSNNGPNVVNRRVVMGQSDLSSPPAGDPQDLVYEFEYTDDDEPWEDLPVGLLVSQTDPNGHTTTYEYFDDPGDPLTLGRLQKITYDDESFETFAYDITAAGTIVTHTNELQRVTKRYFDALQRLIKLEEPDPDGNGSAGKPTTLYRYDAAANLRTMIDAEGKSTTYTYDSRNRLISITRPDPDGSGTGDPAPITSYKYDASGNLIAVVDPLGRMTAMQYDAADRLIATIEPDIDDDIEATWQNPVNRYDVNADGLVDSLDQGAFVVAGMSGALTPLELYELPEITGKLGLFYVDVNGDNEVDSDDIQLVNDYIEGEPSLPPDVPDYGDTDGRAVTRHGYDPAGNLRFTIDANGNQTEYQYDPRSLLSTVIQPPVADPAQSGAYDNPIIEYSYDEAGQRIGMTDPMGRHTTYEFDDAGRLAVVNAPDPDGNSPIWRNETSPMDVDGDGDIDSADATLVENVYNAGVSLNHTYQGYFIDWPPDEDELRGFELDPTGPSGNERLVDVNGDGFVGMVDADLIEDFLNTGTIGEELFSSVPVTRYHYDLAGNLRFIVDPMLNVTEYKYNNRNWLTFEVQEKPSGTKSTVSAGIDLSNSTLLAAAKAVRPITEFQYDTVGMLEHLIDPEDNKTDWQYDDLARVTSESRTIDSTTHTRSYTYDQVGNRLSAVDREGRLITYEYDHLYRNTFERWFADVNDTTADHTLEFDYDLADYLVSTDDTFHSYSYLRDGMSRVHTMSQTITGLVLSGSTPTPIGLSFGYDLVGNRTSLTAEFDGNDDFQNTMEYDALRRLSSVTQTGQAGGNAVVSKHVAFDHNLAGQLNSIYRYAGSTSQSTPGIANTQYSYDDAGRLDGIEHYRGIGTTSVLHISGYDLGWDLANRATEFLFTHPLFADESVYSYSHDSNGQLTSADWVATGMVDESYSYDQNGNRLSSHRSADYEHEQFNQLVEDNEYRYSYDAEGNRTGKGLLTSWNATAGVYEDRQEFSWDHRNRLTEVREYVGNTLVKTVAYAYDAFNQLIRRTVTESSNVSDRFFVLDRLPENSSLAGRVANGGTSVIDQVSFSSAESDQVLATAIADPEGLGQIVLQFDGDGGGVAELSHRYLWGPGVDFQLADEYQPVTNGNGDTRVLLPLVDHLGTVRDLVEYVEYVTGVPDTVLQKHRVYDSFGNILGEFNRGDFNGDGEYTVADADALLYAIAHDMFGDYDGFDVDGDGDLDQDDTRAFVILIVGSVMADANFDGFTDAGDFLIWNANKFTTSDYHWSEGDFNGDGVVDSSDFGIWNANKFTGDGTHNTAVLEHIFAFTGRLLDPATGMQNNLNRWYDAGVGRWVSEDLVGFAARDVNLSRYAHNNVTISVDPNGLDKLGGDGAPGDVDDRQDDEREQNFDELEKELKSRCETEACEKEVDRIIDGLKDAANEIDEEGGPQRFNFLGPVCTDCEMKVLTHFPVFADHFQYETKTKQKGVDHCWGEITLKDNDDEDEVITIDMWAIGTHDFWRPGQNGFGWVADEDR